MKSQTKKKLNVVQWFGLLKYCVYNDGFYIYYSSLQSHLWVFAFAYTPHSITLLSAFIFSFVDETDYMFYFKCFWVRDLIVPPFKCLSWDGNKHDDLYFYWQVLELEEQEYFFSHTLPKMVDLALQLPLICTQVNPITF